MVWHYVVITRDGSRLSLWIDGTERLFTTDGLGTIHINNGSLAIGTDISNITDRRLPGLD